MSTGSSISILKFRPRAHGSQAWPRVVGRIPTQPLTQSARRDTISVEVGAGEEILAGLTMACKTSSSNEFSSSASGWRKPSRADSS